MERLETFLRVKQVESSDGERWITAWATTADEDLQGDVVEPAGAVYQLPIPLLAYHKSDSPVGVVTEAHVSERGIRIRAKISKGVQLADEIWQLVKDGAIGACSVGFKALKSKRLSSGGLLFESWRWLELSLTPCPANPNARIVSVGKSIAYATNADAIRVTPQTAPARKVVTPQQAEAKAARCGDDEWKVMQAGGDAALALLPPEIAKLVDHKQTGRGNDRIYTLRDIAGREVATVDGHGNVAIAGQQKPKAKTEGLTTTQANQVRTLLKTMVTHGEMVEFAKAFGGVMKEAVQPLRERLDRLEASALHDGGFFTLGREYLKGAVVVFDGQTWLATEDTEATPTRGNQGWRLLGRK